MAATIPSFVDKLKNSNPNSICGASAALVGRVPMRQVLERFLAVPLFQRRYCWGSLQWETLLADVDRMANLPSDPDVPHWLGRLTCTAIDGNVTSMNHRTQVIDG